MNEDDIDYLLKIVIVGDSGVGKTNLLSRFTRNIFEENTRNTIGVDFSAIDLKVKLKNVKAQFWDTAGQEKYRAIASAYYKNAHGAIITYDITRRETFENVNNWLKELKEHGDSSIQIMIIGNKSDLESARQVSSEDGKKLAESMGLFFMEVSAKSNKNDCVRTSFNCLIEEILKTMEKEEHLTLEKDLMSIRSKTLIANQVKEKKKESKCC